MKLRNQDEKEIKLELMLTSFLGNLDDKINSINKQGATTIKNFT